MRQIFEDYFYPLSRVQEYWRKPLQAICIICSISSSAMFWAWLLAGDINRAAINYVSCALFLFLTNMSLGVAISEQENPPLS